MRTRTGEHERGSIIVHINETFSASWLHVAPHLDITDGGGTTGGVRAPGAYLPVERTVTWNDRFWS